MEDILLTVKEVAKLLKTSPDYVHKLRKSGVLPFLKIGQYKVRKVSLEKFLEQYEGKDITNPYEIIELERKDEECLQTD
nr:helix-turn-helix domain-containing protein [uncultured Anaerocolumna sp.]